MKQDIRLQTEKTIRSKRKIDYGTIALFGILSAIAVIGVPTFGYIYGYSWLDWTLFGVLYGVTGLGITVGYHRLFSHRSFTAPGWVRTVFLIAGGWAMENSAYKWCSDHARHHQLVDTEEDPYNALRGFWYSHVGWIFEKHPSAYIDKYTAPLRKDKLIMWQHKYYLPIVISGFVLPFIIGFAYNGWIGGISAFLLAGVARAFLVLNSTFCINSICHMWGNQPYDEKNTSRDSWWISLITFGEGYHNYHHSFQRDYRNGPLWYNFDPSKWLIFGLSVFGMASNLTRCAVPAEA